MANLRGIREVPHLCVRSLNGLGIGAYLWWRRLLQNENHGDHRDRNHCPSKSAPGLLEPSGVGDDRCRISDYPRCRRGWPRWLIPIEDDPTALTFSFSLIFERAFGTGGNDYRGHVIVRSCDSEGFIASRMPTPKGRKQRFFRRKRILERQNFDCKGALFGCRWQRSGEMKLP